MRPKLTIARRLGAAIIRQVVFIIDRSKIIGIVWEKERRLRDDSLEKADYEKRFEEQHRELEKKYERDSLSKINAELRVEQLKAKEEAKRVADSLKIVDREKAIEDAHLCQQGNGCNGQYQ